MGPAQRGGGLRPARMRFPAGAMPALWVNHPSRLADAAYKPVQLIRAHETGLSVPETTITNEADTARSFAEQGRTITKLMGSNTISEDGTRKLTWTRVVGPDDDLGGVEITAHMVQRWVPKAYEARVIVIGDHLTAVSIKPGSAASYIDWRSDYDALEYEIVEPPQAVTNGIRRLMKTMNLIYGALDFVITPTGEWTFLEMNAGGQYGWLEAATGAPLTDTLADLLTKGKQ